MEEQRQKNPQATGGRVAAVFFDLDGTLVNTEPLAVCATREVLARYGLTLSERESTWMFGHTWNSIHQTLLAPKRLPLGEKAFCDAVNQCYDRLLGKNCPVVPGAIPCVRRLAARYPLAVVSGSNRRQIRFILGVMGILDQFQEFVGSEDYARSKPAPDAYLEALRRFQIPPEKALAIEDSQAGVGSAKAAGLRVIAVNAANSTPQDLSQADWLIDELAQLDGEGIERFGHG